MRFSINHKYKFRVPCFFQALNFTILTSPYCCEKDKRANPGNLARRCSFFPQIEVCHLSPLFPSPLLYLTSTYLCLHIIQRVNEVGFVFFYIQCGTVPRVNLVSCEGISYTDHCSQIHVSLLLDWYCHLHVALPCYGLLLGFPARLFYVILISVMCQPMSKWTA